MVLWGAIWGLIWGLFGSAHAFVYRGGFIALLSWALVGAAVGWSLRRVLRSEWKQYLDTHVAELMQEHLRGLHIQTDKAPMQPAAAAQAQAKLAVTPSTASAATVTAMQPQTMDAPESVPVKAQSTSAQYSEQPLHEELPAAEVEAIEYQPNALDRLQQSFQNWLAGGNTIVRVGVLILFIGLAFLAKYAADAGMFPPALRMAFIGAAGVGLFAFGFVLRGKALAAADSVRTAYAYTLQGAGVGVLYLTVFAALRLYALLPVGAAFALLVLICVFATLIALLQNNKAMAFIGFAGGFAAPILVSTGSNDYVGLFSYYLLLNVAIGFIAWKKAWRPLNLLGFFATFGVMGAWSALSYAPEFYANTQPFLIAFFLIYALAALFYALRHSLSEALALDTLLLFGTPIAAFSLQVQLVSSIEYGAAFSALALAAFYVLLGYAVMHHSRKQAQADSEVSASTVSLWLAQSYLALALVFVSVAVPLALDAKWTAAVWALEGAAVYWIGQRQQQWFARGTGLALQVLAGMAFLNQGRGAQGDSILHPQFLSLVALALAAWIVTYLVHNRAEQTRDQALTGLRSALAQLVRELERIAPTPLFLIGLAWWLLAGTWQITKRIYPLGQDASISYGYYGLQREYHVYAWLLFYAGSALLLHHWALARRSLPLRVAKLPAYCLLPVLLVAACVERWRMHEFLYSLGWLTWPLVVAIFVYLLRRLDGSQQGKASRLWYWAHVGVVLLALILLHDVLYWLIESYELWNTAWASVIFMLAATGVLAVLTRQSAYTASLGDAPARWPLRPYGRAYVKTAAGLLATVLVLATLGVAVSSRAHAPPLPYVPLLNPTDISLLLALAVVALYLLRMRAFGLLGQGAAGAPALGSLRRVQALLAVAFVVVNTMWLRVAHHYWGVEWDASALYHSFVVQAGYSILWTTLALCLMVLAHRRSQRSLWMVGAALLGLTLLKLLVVDLSNSGGAERIVSFIAVGALMLIVGYFAPIPPKAQAIEKERNEE